MTLLRCANVIGPDVQTPADAVLPAAGGAAVLGFDPRLQFIHEDAVVAVLQPPPRTRRGAFNVAGPACSCCPRRSGGSSARGCTLPGFAVGSLGSVLRQARLADFSPEQLGFLTYGRGIDTTRMRTDLGFEPQWTTAGAFEDFSRSLTPTGGYATRMIDTASRLVDPATVELTDGGQGVRRG